MNKEQILKQIEQNNHTIFKLGYLNNNKCKELLFENTKLSILLNKEV